MITLPQALPRDIPALQTLIEQSARVLSAGFYSQAETEAAIRHGFGVDSRLIADGTCLVAEGGSGIVGCGGWSRRRTLYGGGQRPAGGSDLLEPAGERASIRVTDILPDGTPIALVRIGRSLGTRP